MYVGNALGLYEQHYLYASGSLIWLVPYWHNNLVTSSNTTPAENKHSKKTAQRKYICKELYLARKSLVHESQFVQEDLKRKKSKSNDNQFELKRNKSYDNPLAGWNSKLSLEG